MGFEKFYDFFKICINIIFDGYGFLVDCIFFDFFKFLVKNFVIVLDFCVGFNDIIMKFVVFIYGKFSRDCDKCILIVDFGVIL